MSKPLDLLGARASTAGDAFHETWALRETLRLLDPRSGLTEVFVEGARDGAETDPSASWDGVDCALYFDRLDLPDHSRVELIQLKYSVASPRKSWTLNRFCKSTSRTGNNSVARRLGAAFRAEAKGKLDDQVRRTVTICLVTNQPISKSLTNIVSKAARGGLKGRDFDQLHKATGLSKRYVKLFCECLKLEGGEDSRDRLRTQSTQDLAQLLVAPPRDTVDGLLGKIHAQMMPENQRAVDKATVMGWLGCGQEEALFPRDPRIEYLGPIINRAVCHDLAQTVIQHPLVCFDGAGGCGKTTAVMNLERALPKGSKVILYDCYGGGSYVDASQARHRPLEAFTQLANELARVTQSPLLFPFNSRADMASAFRRKLEQAAELFRVEQPPDALLTLVIDAADNVVRAARRSAPEDLCFVDQLVTFTDLPTNVRVVITARSGRVNELALPEDTPRVLCPHFLPEETAALVRLKGFDVSPVALEDFHELSNQTPRVQATALEGASNLSEAIDFLRPSGKSLSDLFKARLDEARSRASVDTPRAVLCAALTVLPTPIPIPYFAKACKLPSDVCRDLIVEITRRNARLADDQIEISNEDFEDFCDKEGESQQSEMLDTAANLLKFDRLTSEYAATHVFDLLALGGRKADLQECLQEKDATKVIKDPVKRRQVELGRLRAALHVAAGTSDKQAIGTTMFLGAESMRTAGKVQQLMWENTDLSAAFVPDTVGRLVLNDPEQRPSQGPLLMHLAASRARSGEFFEVRERLSAANSWLRTLFDERDELRDWRFKPEDIVASLTAVYRQTGWINAEQACSRWSPKNYSANLLRLLIRRIALEDGPTALEGIGQGISAPWRFLVVNAYVRAGTAPTKEAVNAALSGLKELDFANLEADDALGRRQSMQQALFQEIMVFLETASREPTLCQGVAQVLDDIFPEASIDLKNTYLGQPASIDLAFRSAHLRALLAGVPVDLEAVYAKPVELDRKTATTESIAQYERNVDQYEQVAKLVPIYQAVFSGWKEPDAPATKDAIDSFTRLHERSRRPFEYERVRIVIGERLLDLFAWQQTPIEDRLKTLEHLAHHADVFSTAYEVWYGDLLHNPSSHTLVTAKIDTQAARLLSDRLKATEKADDLIKIARTCLPYYRDNAEHYFTKALEIAEEVDLETIDVLHALARMISRIQPDTAEHRGRVNRFARLIHMAGDLLQHEDGFPQKEAIKAMTVASPAVAAAIVSRWSDEGFSNSSSDLAAFVRAALSNETLRPAQGLILSCLLETPSKPIESHVREAIVQGGVENASEILEEYLLRHLSDSVPGQVEPEIGSLIDEAESLNQTPPSLSAMKEVVSFRENHKQELAFATKSDGDDRTVPFERIESDWSEVDPCDPVAMRSAVKANLKAQIYDQTPFFAQMRAKTKLSDRSSHLDALCEMAKADHFTDYRLTGLKDALAEWDEAALTKWRNEALADAIVELGAKTLGYSWYEEAAFNGLLASTGLDNKVKCALICRLVESHAFELGSQSLLKLLTAFVNHLETDEAMTLVDTFLSFAEERLDISVFDLSRYDLDTHVLPDSVDALVALLIYRYLGDIDSRIRWRACHSLRQAVRIGETELINAVFDMALDPPKCLTFNDIPFHGLSADLSLAIAISRVAVDAPALVAQLESRILALWDKRKPHVLIGHFLGRALSLVQVAGHPMKSSQDVIASLSGQPANRAPRPEGRSNNEIPEFEESGERFRFDSMDAIPYWYNPAIDLFADLSGGLFLQTAERWIVEEWGATENASHWEKEPRQMRFDDRSYGLWSNRQGSRPVIDRHWHYLQWHGVFAAVGELLPQHAVRIPVEDEWVDTLEDWMQSNSTTYDDIWLADLRTPPPLELRYWQLPQPDEASWVDQATFIDLSVECLTEDGMIVLSGHREARTYYLGDQTGYEEVHNSSAFVDPITAEALLHSFASAPDPREVYLPEPDRFTRMKPQDQRFHLTPATSQPLQHRDGGIDLRDPLRFGVQGIVRAPSQAVTEVLALNQETLSRPFWTRGSGGKPVVVYRTWSSVPGTAEDSRRTHWDNTFAEGARLVIEGDALCEFMNSIERDLIITVHLTRRTGDKYGESQRTEEREQRVARAYILKRDGCIQSEKSSHGTWQKAG